MRPATNSTFAGRYRQNPRPRRNTAHSWPKRQTWSAWSTAGRPAPNPTPNTPNAARRWHCTRQRHVARRNNPPAPARMRACGCLALKNQIAAPIRRLGYRLRKWFVYRRGWSWLAFRMDGAATGAGCFRTAAEPESANKRILTQIRRRVGRQMAAIF